MKNLNLKDLIDNKDNIIIVKKILDRLEITERDRLNIINDLKSLNAGSQDNSIFLQINNRNIVFLDYLPIISIKFTDFNNNVWIMNNGVRNETYINKIVAIELSSNSLCGYVDGLRDYKEVLTENNISTDDFMSISKEQYYDFEDMYMYDFIGSYKQTYNSDDKLSDIYYPSIKIRNNKIVLVLPFGSNIDEKLNDNKLAELVFDKNKIIIKKGYTNNIVGKVQNDIELNIDNSNNMILYSDEIELKGDIKTIKLYDYKMIKL